jgi:hypothetical protein
MAGHDEHEGMDGPIGVCAPGEERSFDHYARLVRRLLHVPTALVSIVEAHRQIFPGVVGLPEPYLSARETPLSHSFCQYVVARERPLIITDARDVPDLADNLAIRDLNVIAYAGWPLVDGNGRTVGSLCAIDSVPREWTAEEIGLLKDLALACSAELQQSRRVAKDSENLARTIFASVNVAMAFYDTHERLVLANDLAERAVKAAGFRLDQPPYAGANVRRSDNQTPIPLEEQVIPRALRGDLSNHEMEWLGPPGNQTAVVAAAQRVLRSDGTLWGTLIAAHDVTDLARSLQVREEFIATVSHELRTPLTAILGYLEILDDELDEREGRVPRTLRTIERAALRLQERVTELLDTADRRRRLDVQSTDVSGLALGMSSTFGEQAKAAGIQLSVQADPPQWAVVDARRVEQALENLVSNALKYTGPGGHVNITVGGLDDAVQVAVADTGIGMSSDEVVQAFDSFWRADSARQGAVQGIGIGLTLVREIVDAHHGFVDLTSRPGEGTTVTVTFPRNYTPSADPA